jgi:hypothetical protein
VPAFPDQEEADAWGERLGRLDATVRLFPADRMQDAVDLAAATIETRISLPVASAAPLRAVAARLMKNASWLEEASWLDAELHRRAGFASTTAVNEPG